jgi:hypothetical protein
MHIGTFLRSQLPHASGLVVVLSQAAARPMAEDAARKRRSLLTPKKQIARYFVRKETGQGDAHQYVCVLCNPEWEADSTEEVKTYTPTKSGYAWGTQHLAAKHRREIEEAKGELVLSTILSQKAINTYDWIDWIVSDNHALSFCEKAHVRYHTKGNLAAISVKTLKARMERVVLQMQLEFSKLLPKIWSTLSGSICCWPWTSFGR